VGAGEGVHGLDVAQLEAGDLFGGGEAVGLDVVGEGAVGGGLSVAAWLFFALVSKRLWGKGR
jgi:hypothetical protein